MIPDDFIYEPYEDAQGLPMWSCHRIGAGIVGYGHTQKQALEDFLNKEDFLLPLPRGEYINYHPEQPPEFRELRTYRDEDFE